MSMERLQKVIARSGITSRRKAEAMIESGKVAVNGEIVTELGTKVSQQDQVEVEGVPIEKEEPVYFLLYKPRSVISSVEDEKGRKVVTDFLPEMKERIYPVGRLDYDSSGLILLTNDGDFANLLMHPSHQIEKVYVVKIKGLPAKQELNRLKEGVKADDEVLKALNYHVMSTDFKKETMILKITLNEGKNRHIHRMIEALGYRVSKLKREKYGTLTLEGMQPGEVRELKPYEVKQLRASTNKKGNE